MLLVDDHAIVRRGIREVISELHADAEIVEASDGVDALDQVDRGHFDLAIVDLSLPRRGGLDLLHELQAHSPETRVVVVSMHAEREYVVRAFRAGAAGYVTKQSAADELPTAIGSVLAGDRYVDPLLVPDMVAQLGRPDDGVAILSDRELQVLRLIGSGKSVKQISGELSLSEKTVSTYRTRLLKKLGLQGTAELIRYAVERHLA